MAKKLVKHPPPKPWKPDIARWLPFLKEGQPVRIVGVQQDEPTKGWQLFDWKTLEDRPQE
jgi:hypothetical protein